MKIFLLLLLSLFLYTSCGKEDVHDHSHEGHNHASHGQEKEHSHKAPYGGVLHELDGHKASLEWLVEKDSLKLYIHDGCAERDIRIQQKDVSAIIKTADGEQEILLEPIVSDISGNKLGDSSAFQNTQDGVKFEAIEVIKVKLIEIQGITYENLESKVKK